MDIQKQHNFITTIDQPIQLINIRRHIQKPNDLLDKSQLNRLYPEAWENVDLRYNASKLSTSNQCKNVCRMTNKFTKYHSSIRNANFGTLIYQRFQEKQNNVWKIGQNPQRWTPSSPDHELTFHSRFQSGNLSRAYFREDKRKGKIYTLILENDTNTFGYNQWFYFCVRSKKAYETVKIEIVNLRKSFSLFNRGMKIAVFCSHLYAKDKIGWHRGGNNIQYDLNGLEDGGYKLATLSFQYTFTSDKETYFAYAYPYTFTQLKKHLKEYQLAHKQIAVKKIGLSLLKNQIFMVEEKILKKTKKNKDVLLVMARVHPGETVSSFVVKGFLDALFSDVSQAQYLRSKLSVKVIPMQNPDGVIHGNTRTSVIGNDLNRRWILPSETMHPEIFCIKKYIQQLEREGVKIFGMIDLHGHTKKQSSFFYGCCAKKNHSNHYKVRLLNYLMGNCDRNFKPEFSSFYVGSSKRSTARVTFFSEFCDFSYTLESTFMSAHENMLHCSIKDYEDLGKNLLKSVAHLRETINPTQSPLLDSHLRKIAHEVLKNPQKLGKAQEKQSESGSSSNPSQFCYSAEYLQENVVKKKERNRSARRYRAIKRDRLEQSEEKVRLSMGKKPSLAMKDAKTNMSRDIIDKLPLLSFETKELPAYDIYNFKSRRFTTRKKKVLLDRTID